MATPTAKTTQSSLLSFFTTDPSPPPAAASDYEQLRQAKIRRNREFFHNLGIQTHSLLPPPAARKSTSKPSKPFHEAAVPPRRSTRKRPAPAEDDRQVEPEKAYVDSAVSRYSTTGSNTAGKIDSSSHISCFDSTFKLVGKTLGDSRLTKIYAMDIVGLCPDRQLIAAGGHGGFISVFGTDIEQKNEKLDGKKEEEMSDDENEDDSEWSESLMCWKSSRSWVSGVSFVKNNPTLLLSSSNDGRLLIWDVGKQSASLALPPIVAESDTIHSNGIFSMDQADGTVATVSKDSSLALTRIAGNGAELVKERSISGHHSGVIRGVCFRKTKDILADCGADGLICVLDARAPEPCTVSIESDHVSGVNTVNWSPTNEFLLLSASKDPVLLLYDIRNNTQPFLKLHGHVESSSNTCRQIYRPAFVDGGRKVATPGQGSAKISLFNLDNGEIISKGAVGYDANLVYCHLNEFEGESIWIAARQINKLALPH